MKKLSLFLIALAILSLSVSASSISGEVFDFSLDKVMSAKVEINSTPVQRQITEDGSFSFDIPPGNYLLKAEEIVEGVVIASTEENIEIPDQGDYNLDLLLFPLIEEIEVEAIEVEEDLFPEPTPTSNYILFVFILIFIGIVLFGYAFYKKKPGKDDDELIDVLSFIKKQGGRTTQKDIRRAFPQSEAKISLILTDLESQGKIKKIKKGRGNVVILK